MIPSIPDPTEREGRDARETPDRGSLYWRLDTPGGSRSACGNGEERIGRYRLLRALGQGGMGQVYLAEQTEPVARTVALKLIRRGMDTREVVARFESERQALALMSHPSIAHVFDAGTTDDGSPYFVMEYVPGLPIVEYCETNRLSLAARLELFVKVCEAIHHAHQKAIIHRDIKPQNVLVAELDGACSPKVIDFGIAKALGSGRIGDTALTAMGQVIGTPEYMSPEQAGSGELDIDTRTDIYSLGVLLYELLTGELPFDSTKLRQGGYAELLRTICEEVPPRPSTRVEHHGAAGREPCAEDARVPCARELRGDLDWITMKALEKDRMRRYASASELAEDVRRHLAHEPVLAGPPSTLYRLGKLLRRHREKWIAAVVLVALLGIFVAAYLARARQLSIEEARKLLAKGEASVAELESALGQRQTIAARLERVQGELQPWLPVWEREEESGLLAARKTLMAGIDQHYFDALESFEQARQAAPPATDVAFRIDRAKEDLTWRQWQEASRERHVELSEDFFRRQLESMKLGTYARELEGKGNIDLVSDPPGADVHCFRYEEIERRLVPIPFDPVRGADDPAKGLAGNLFLRVERVWGPRGEPFRTGDRVLRVGSKETQTATDLARALAGVAADVALEVEVERNGAKERFDWTPFPSAFYDGKRESKPGKLLDIRYQLDLTFEAYPLELSPGAHLGVTRADGPLKLRLPKGSYLLLLRKEGLADARLPVSVPGGPKPPTVRLYAIEDVPPGFVHVPAGEFDAGGDREAYDGREKGRESVGDFFMSRGEVSCAEYLELLNDKSAAGSIDADGFAKYEEDWTRPELRQFLLPDAPPRLQLLPRPFSSKETVAIRPKPAGGGFELAEPRYADLPVLGISMTAAVEYAHWMSGRHGGRWRFRLPRDSDWEKAARGADSRAYVWGNELVRTYMKEGRAHLPEEGLVLEPRFAYPADESVYGVRDLAGSAAEPTTVQALREKRYFVYRGGYWISIDDRDARAASRNRTIPWERYTHLGIRLVAEPAAR